jgi:hydroxyacylglutathione hydrolase
MHTLEISGLQYDQGRLEETPHIFLGELQDRIDEIDRDKPVVTFCGSGVRSIIAASLPNGMDLKP